MLHLTGFPLRPVAKSIKSVVFCKSHMGHKYTHCKENGEFLG